LFHLLISFYTTIRVLKFCNNMFYIIFIHFSWGVSRSDIEEKVDDLFWGSAEFQVQEDDVSDERPQKIYGEILYHIPIVPKGSGG